MNELEWLKCMTPEPMLKFLRGKASDRKLRLFAVACCHSIWRLLTDMAGRDAVEVGEHYADGGASVRELAKAHKQAQDAWTATNNIQPQAYELSRDIGEAASMLITAIDAAIKSTDKDSFIAAWSANICAAHTRGKEAAILACSPTYDRSEVYVREELAGRQKQYGHQSRLFRDIFGNPFRTFIIDPSWLTSTAVGLAKKIYDERDFDKMPILANALMDAGCDSEEIIAHCRNEGPHVRGCWVVDLILGKE